MAMKNKNLSLVASAVLVAGAMWTGNTASAEELPQTKAQQQFSVTHGFKETSLPVLQRAGSIDQKQVSESLIGKLRPASAHQSTANGTTLHTAGDQWSLDVTGDGRAADFEDLAVGARAHSLGKPVSQAMSAAELEQ